jgi:hypothetical protein
MVIREVLWSTAVHHGPTGGAKHLHHGQHACQTGQGDFGKALLTEVYRERERRLAKVPLSQRNALRSRLEAGDEHGSGAGWNGPPSARRTPCLRGLVDVAQPWRGLPWPHSRSPRSRGGRQPGRPRGHRRRSRQLGFQNVTAVGDLPAAAHALATGKAGPRALRGPGGGKYGIQLLKKVRETPQLARVPSWSPPRIRNRPSSRPI